MKKTLLALVCVLACLTATTAPAQDAPLLGTSHYSFELDIMFLQHRTFETDDGGVYVGLAGYGHLGDNWYLGGEVGAGAALGLFTDSSSYNPFEVNAKRAYRLAEHWIVDVGAGLSYSRVTFEEENWFSEEEESITGWVFGSQALADLIFQAGNFQVGLKLKYQLTTDMDEVAELTNSDDGWDYSNFKIGVQVGLRIPD